jgi:hypothetical protein
MIPAMGRVTIQAINMSRTVFQWTDLASRFKPMPMMELELTWVVDTGTPLLNGGRTPWVIPGGI